MLTAGDPPLVATAAALANALEWVSTASLLAIDTEFVREKTYYPKLCLIQLATDEHATCIDCLADLDLGPLLEQLFAAERTWVLHSARQDLEVLWQLANLPPPRLIDTQIAAALSGSAAQVGLEGLLRETLGVELGESYARTDWSRRPLPVGALAYALDDVRYLLPALRTLTSHLAQLGRSSWLEEDCARLLAEPPVADATTVWSRLKGVHALPLRSRCAALTLVRWREREAQLKDRPRRWILADEDLLAVAAAMPNEMSQLERCLPPRTAAKIGKALLVAVTEHSAAEIERIVLANAPPPQADKSILKTLQSAVRARAEQLGIEPEILATRRDLAAVARGERPALLTEGWRGTALADVLAAAAAPPTKA
jgi:ribonuclease D